MQAAVACLRQLSELAHGEMKQAVEGVTQAQAWSVLPSAGADYIHTDGSIHGITLHVATCKVMYGSIAFRNSEFRWRDVAQRVEGFEPDWPAALAYLEEAHTYWMSTWAALRNEDLEGEVPHFSGKLWPAWRIVREMIHHDSYHAGQIALLRYAVGETDVPPPSQAEDIRQYCSELPSW